MMGKEKTWTFDKDQMLIELVKNVPGLYDFQTPFYSDNEYKRKAWSDIANKLSQKDPKARWESLRGQYRKHLHKLRNKTGRASRRNYKWRFHDDMSFLNDFINVDASRASSFSEFEVIQTDFDADEMIERKPIISQQNNANGSQENESDNESVATSSSKASATFNGKDKSSSSQQDSEIFTLIKYILENKEKENAPLHPMDQFFSFIAATVKNFSPIDQHLVKTQIFTLVSDIERKYVTENSSPTGTL